MNPPTTPIDIANIPGLGDFSAKIDARYQSGQPVEIRTLYLRGRKAFLVVHANTIELRTDPQLRDHLREKYESVMESRYFGRGGIEIVLSGQLAEQELADLIRLSYTLTP